MRACAGAFADQAPRAAQDNTVHELGRQCSQAPHTADLQVGVQSHRAGLPLDIDTLILLDVPVKDL